MKRSRSFLVACCAGLAISLGRVGDLAAAVGPAGPAVAIGVFEQVVHRGRDGVLACVRYPRERRGQVSATVAAIDAFELLLRDEVDRRINLHAPWVEGSARSALREFVLADSGAALGCLEGLIPVSDRIEGHERIVVHSVPQDRLEALAIDVPGTLARMASKVRSGEASHVEAMALLEAVPVWQVPLLRDDVLATMDRAVGDGFGASADRRWVRRDGTPLRQGFSLWGKVAGQCSRRDSMVERTPLPAGVMERATPEQSLLLLGHRANDPAVVPAVRGHLTVAGWVRVARLLPAACEESP